MKRIDIVYYSFLAVGIAVGALAIVRLRYDSASQFMVILILALFYLIWGASYHHLKGDINKKLFIEYLVIAAIASVAGFLIFVS